MNDSDRDLFLWSDISMFGMIKLILKKSMFRLFVQIYQALFIITKIFYIFCLEES